MTDLTFDLTSAETLSSSGSQKNKLLRADPVTGLVDYFLDIKPFHTKLLETIIEYIHRDLIRVTVTEVIKNKIHLSFPGCPRFLIGRTISSTEIVVVGRYSINPEIGISLIKDGIVEQYVTPLSASYIPGMINETTITLKEPITDIEQFVGGELIVHCKKDEWCDDGFGLSSFGSSSVYPAFYPGGSQVPFDLVNKFIVIPGNHTGRFVPGTTARLYFQVMDDITFNIVAYPASFDVYTVQNSAHFYGMIPSRTIPTNPSTLDNGIDPYTIITFTAPFTGIPVPGPGQTLIAYAEILPFVITSIVPYSNISNIPGVLSEFATSDNTPDESAYLNIGSNAFVISGNKVAGFKQGIQFIVSGGANDGVYHVLYSNHVAGETIIRPVEDIRHLGSPGQITFRTLGYSETDEFCPKISGTNISVKVRERVIIEGMGIDLFDEVITYNLENKDVIGYEYPKTTIFSELEPVIFEQTANPLLLNPLLDDQTLWFNTSTSIMYQLHGDHWIPEVTVFWMKTDSSGNYIQLYRRTKGLLDTGWMEDVQGGYNIITPAHRVKFDIISIAGTEFIISGNPSNLIPNIVGSARLVQDGSVGQDFAITTYTFNAGLNRTTIDGTIPLSYLDGKLVIHTKNAFVYPFGSKPYQVFHSYVDGNSDIISIGGGNYLSRFMGTNFSAKVFVLSVEQVFDDLKVMSWVATQTGANTIEITLDNPSRLSMFEVGNIIEITRTKDTESFLQISSIGTLSGNTLPLTVLGDPTEISSVLAGVFDPIGPNGNPVTKVVVNSIPAYNTMESIWYDMPSPVLLQIFNQISDLVPVSNTESTAMSDEMILTENHGNISQNLAQSYIFDSVSFNWGVEGVDVVEWFQFNILEVDSILNTLKVHGLSVYLTIMPGQKIRILGIPGFDGLYPVVSVVQDLIDPMISVITLTGPLPFSSGIGGVIEPADYDTMILSFRDTIGTTFVENADATVLTGSPMIGGFDSNLFDVGTLDESVETYIDLLKV